MWCDLLPRFYLDIDHSCYTLRFIVLIIKPNGITKTCHGPKVAGLIPTAVTQFFSLPGVDTLGRYQPSGYHRREPGYEVEAVFTVGPLTLLLDWLASINNVHLNGFSQVIYFITKSKVLPSKFSNNN